MARPAVAIRGVPVTPFDDASHHGDVHVRQPRQVQAPLAGPMWTEVGEQICIGLDATGEIERERAFPRGERDRRDVPFSPAVVSIVPAAEPDDRRAPHHRRLTGHLGGQRDQDYGVGAHGRVGHAVEELGHGPPGGHGDVVVANLASVVGHDVLHGVQRCGARINLAILGTEWLLTPCSSS